ncbi:putative ribonuclease H-like domain-containing protein [Tanacetum coccineum]
MNHQTSSVPQIAYQSPQVTTQPMIDSPLMDSGFVVPVFSPGDDLIACLNKAMAFLIAVASSSATSTGRQGQSYSGTGYKSYATSSRINNASGSARVDKCYNCQGEGHMARQCTPPKRPRNSAWYKEKAMLAEAQEARQILEEKQLTFLADPRTEDLDTYDSDCDDLLNAQAVLMVNISNYDSNVILEVPYSETYLNDMENQSVHAIQDFEQTPAVDFSDNEIHTQQDSMILSVIEQMSEQMINHVNNWEKANKEQNNESLTTELERYKEQEKLALKEQVDSLEQNLSKQIKEKECLLQTFIVFKSESKEKEDKYMENKIDLEKEDKGT